MNKKQKKKERKKPQNLAFRQEYGQGMGILDKKRRQFFYLCFEQAAKVKATRRQTTNDRKRHQLGSRPSSHESFPPYESANHTWKHFAFDTPS